MGFRASFPTGLLLTVELDTTDPCIGQTVTVQKVTVIVFNSKKVNITEILDSITNEQFMVTTRDGCNIELQCLS